MKTIKRMTVGVVTLLIVAVFSGCDLYSYSSLATRPSYDNPTWAAPYYSGARYYYLPDIETYYDLSSREFIYLNNGQWNYSSEFPSIMGNFDLNNCFSIVLDVNVFQPWMHHQYYVSHYPRHYYRDYYDHSNIPYVRGFNENSRSAIYWGDNERNRARKWDNEGTSNRQFKYPKQERNQKNIWNNNQDERRSGNNGFSIENSQNNSDYNKGRTVTNQPANPSRSDNNNISRQPSSDNSNQQPTGRSSEVQRTTQGTNYYGRTIGQPVKVEKQMRKQNDGENKKKNGNEQNNQGRR